MEEPIRLILRNNLLKKIINNINLWTKLSIIVPVFSTLTLIIFYFISSIEIHVYVYIGCFLYFLTATVWWFWTMLNLKNLTTMLKNASDELQNVTIELKSIRKEII